MRKLTTFLLLLAMLIPTAGAQSTDIFKKKKKKNSKTEAVDKAKADSIAKAKKSPDRKSTRLNSSHFLLSRMPSSA